MSHSMHHYFQKANLPTNGYQVVQGQVIHLKIYEYSKESYSSAIKTLLVENLTNKTLFRLNIDSVYIHRDKAEAVASHLLIEIDKSAQIHSLTSLVKGKVEHIYASSKTHDEAKQAVNLFAKSILDSLNDQI